jgi:hypothetical protein
VGELARVAAPGGRIIIVTWCHRDLELGETCLKPKEQVHFAPGCNRFCLIVASKKEKHSIEALIKSALRVE